MCAFYYHQATACFPIGIPLIQQIVALYAPCVLCMGMDVIFSQVSEWDPLLFIRVHVFTLLNSGAQVCV